MGDQLERRILQLEIEATALKREKGIREEISNLKELVAPLNAKWEAERGRADEIKEIKEKLETLEAKALQAERVGDYEKAADLKYGAIPDLKAHLAKMEREEAERRANRNKNASGEGDDDESILDEVVTPEDIAGVISRWTGIPVSKLSQTDRERLLKLD